MIPRKNVNFVVQKIKRKLVDDGILKENDSLKKLGDLEDGLRIIYFYFSAEHFCTTLLYKP